MNFLDSSTISLTNLEPTTSTLTNNSLMGSTTVGATTTTGVAGTLSKDENGELFVDKKKAVATSASFLGGTSTITLSGCTGLPEAYAEEAQALNWTAAQTEEVYYLKDQEELFGSLPEEEQLKKLARTNQRIEELEAEQTTVGRHR